jgi:GT2 family glycosyltransferase
MSSMNKLNKSDVLTSVIVLNYNAGELLIDCIQSLVNTNNYKLEIIVVDNISTDNSHKTCKEKFPEIKLIENKENMGYCEGNNIGIRDAKGEFIVILNPDTIVEPDWLDELMKAFLKFGDGMYQPKILATTDHNLILSTGNMVQLFGFGFSRGRGENDSNQYDNDQNISYASGACLFTSSKIMKSLSGFDSFLFAYHDDLDLCWRASLQGINSYYVHKSILAVTGFYAKRGFLLMKIKASLNILINLRKIHTKYSEIQKIRKITDKKIIKKFLDNIEVPSGIMKQNQNNFFNKFLRKLSNRSRQLI